MKFWFSSAACVPLEAGARFVHALPSLGCPRLGKLNSRNRNATQFGCRRIGGAPCALRPLYVGGIPRTRLKAGVGSRLTKNLRRSRGQQLFRHRIEGPADGVTIAGFVLTEPAGRDQHLDHGRGSLRRFVHLHAGVDDMSSASAIVAHALGGPLQHGDISLPIRNSTSSDSHAGPSRATIAATIAGANPGISASRSMISVTS